VRANAPLNITDGIRIANNQLITGSHTDSPIA
jgi:hypothetical protein